MFALNLLRRHGKSIKQSTLIPTRYKSKFKDGGEHATFNDMPIPKGSWNDDYSRKQHRYNMILLSGIASLIGSVIFVVSSDEMEFNYTVPDYPYEEGEK